LAYTTEDEVLYRAKLSKSDVHATPDTATAIIAAAIEDASAVIDALTRHPSGWSSSESYYKAVYAAASDLAASYLCQEDIAARSTGRVGEEVLIDRATQLYNRAMAALGAIPGAHKLFIASTPEETESR